MIGAFRSYRQKMSDVNHLSGPLRKRKFSSTGSKGHCLWFVIVGFRSVLWVSVFQGSLLVILLWPKPDVNIPNMPLTLYKTFAWQTFASLRLFTCLVYVSTYCVPIAHLRQNKPFPLLYLGHAQIIRSQNSCILRIYRKPLYSGHFGDRAKWRLPHMRYKQECLVSALGNKKVVIVERWL